MGFAKWDRSASVRICSVFHYIPTFHSIFLLFTIRSDKGVPSGIQLQSGVIGLPASVPSKGLFGSKSLSIVDSVPLVPLVSLVSLVPLVPLVPVPGTSSTLPLMYLSMSKSLSVFPVMGSVKYFFMSRKS